MDLALRPEHMHRIIKRTTEAMTARLDQLESKGLLRGPRSLIHCTGAWSDDIPAEGYDPNHVRAKDIWTMSQAQIFSTASPAMHEEFDIEYSKAWYARFGLGYYGCCEPLDDKIDLVRKLPNVRKISMSPWVDLDRGAERIGRDYVFSRKPSPAIVGVEHWNPEAVEKEVKATLKACARHGCPVEIILKDISTVRREPQRLWEWSDIVRRLIGA